MDQKYDCNQCYWWNKTFGCQNTDWTTGKVTDPSIPDCGPGFNKYVPIGFRKIKWVVKHDSK